MLMFMYIIKFSREINLEHPENLCLEQVLKWFDILTGSLGVNNVFQNSSALINYFNAVQSLTQNGIQEIQKMNFTKVIFLLSVL